MNLISKELGAESTNWRGNERKRDEPVFGVGVEVVERPAMDLAEFQNTCGE
jgi:hypothetical protein